MFLNSTWWDSLVCHLKNGKGLYCLHFHKCNHLNKCATILAITWCNDEWSNGKTGESPKDISSILAKLEMVKLSICKWERNVVIWNVKFLPFGLDIF